MMAIRESTTPRGETMIRATTALIAVIALAFTGEAIRADDGGYGGSSDDGRMGEARQLIEMGSWGSAVWSLKQVLADDPDNPDAHNLLAFSYRNVGQYDLAERHYDRALAIDPAHRGAHAYLGVLYLETGRPGMARHCLDRLETLCGHNCREYEQLRSAIEDGDEAG